MKREEQMKPRREISPAVKIIESLMLLVLLLVLCERAASTRPSTLWTTLRGGDEYRRGMIPQLRATTADLEHFGQQPPRDEPIRIVMLSSIPLWFEPRDKWNINQRLWRNQVEQSLFQQSVHSSFPAVLVSMNRVRRIWEHGKQKHSPITPQEPPNPSLGTHLTSHMENTDDILAVEQDNQWKVESTLQGMNRSLEQPFLHEHQLPEQPEAPSHSMIGDLLANFILDEEEIMAVPIQPFESVVSNGHVIWMLTACVLSTLRQQAPLVPKQIIRKRKRKTKIRKVPRRTILSDLQDFSSRDLDEDELDLLLLDLKFPSLLEEEYSFYEYDTGEEPEDVELAIMNDDESTTENNEDEINQFLQASSVPESWNIASDNLEDDFGMDDSFAIMSPDAMIFDCDEETNVFLKASNAPESWQIGMEELGDDEFDSYFDQYSNDEETMVNNDDVVDAFSLFDSERVSPLINTHYSDHLTQNNRVTVAKKRPPPPPPPAEGDDYDGLFNDLELQMLNETEVQFGFEMDWNREDEDEYMDEEDWKVLQDSLTTSTKLDQTPAHFLEDDHFEQCDDVDEWTNFETRDKVQMTHLVEESKDKDDIEINLIKSASMRSRTLVRQSKVGTMPFVPPPPPGRSTTLSFHSGGLYQGVSPLIPPPPPRRLPPPPPLPPLPQENTAISKIPPNLPDISREHT